MNIPYAVKTGIGILLKNFQRKNIEKNCKIIWSVQKKVVSLHQKQKDKRIKNKYKQLKSK